MIGNVGKDPQKVITDLGKELSFYTLATPEYNINKITKQKEQFVTWHNILAFGALAGFCNNSLKKGDKCFIEGKIKIKKYNHDGVNKIGVTIIAYHVEVMSIYNKKSKKEKDCDSDDFYCNYYDCEFDGD